MAGQSTKHILIVAPAERIDKFGVLKKLAGKFDAFIDAGSTSDAQRQIVAGSRTPFCDGAKALLADGTAQPIDVLIMRHAGSEHDALKASVGIAAKLSIREETNTGRPRFVPWAPHPRAAPMIPGDAPMRETEGKVTLPHIA